MLVTGSRDWTSRHVEVIYRELVKLPPGTIVVHGAAPGVDEIAGLIATELGLIVRDYPARWDVFGPKAAGPIRNRHMFFSEHTIDEPIDLVLAFHEDVNAKSKGTKNMLTIVKANNVPYELRNDEGVLYRLSS